MPAIETKLDPRDATFAKNREAMAALVADLRAKVARVEQGGGEAACAKHVARGKLLPRERVRALLDPGSPFLELSQLAALRHVRRRHRRRRHHHRHRPRRGPRMRDRLQRRDGQRRHLLPDDGEEAPARAGDRAREPPAVHLPGRLGRREPAEPGSTCFPIAITSAASSTTRRRCRRKAFRRSRSSWARARRAALTCRRCRDESIIVKEPGHDLSRRPAAREGRDRRDRQRRGAGRRRRAHARVRRRRPLRAGRSPRARDRAAHRRPPESRQARRDRDRAQPREPLYRADELYGVISADIKQALRRARGDRAHRRRQRARRIQGALRDDAGHRLRAHLGLSGRHRRQQRRALFGIGAEGRALHRALRAARHSAACSCRTSPASWSERSTRPAASRATAPRWSPRCRARRCRSSR